MILALANFLTFCSDLQKNNCAKSSTCSKRMCPAFSPTLKPCVIFLMYALENEVELLQPATIEVPVWQMGSAIVPAALMTLIALCTSRERERTTGGKSNSSALRMSVGISKLSKNFWMSHRAMMIL